MADVRITMQGFEDVISTAIGSASRFNRNMVVYVPRNCIPHSFPLAVAVLIGTPCTVQHETTVWHSVRCFEISTDNEGWIRLQMIIDNENAEGVQV